MFYYEGNIDLLSDAEAEIIFFSPHDDRSLPDRTIPISFQKGNM
jgi:cobyrinic acid a,c-diamide synthase